MSKDVLMKQELKNFTIQDLENAKKDLLQRQDRIRWYIEHDINSGTFERNMINDLTIMIELKEKIKVLEFYLQLSG